MASALHSCRLCRAIFAMCVAFTLAASAAAHDFERWFDIRIAGEHAGWMNQSQKTTGDRIASRSEMTMTVARGATTVSIHSEGEFIETKDGQPISMTSSQRFGATPIVTQGIFTPRANGFDLKLETTQNGAKTTSSKTLPPIASGAKGGAKDRAWLAPAAALALTKKQLGAGATEITLDTIDPSNGPEIETMTLRGIKPMTITIDHRDRAVFECTSTLSSAPITSTQFLDRDGIPVRFSANLGGIALEFEESTKAVAQQTSARAPEIMVATFVRPDRVIAHPRRAKSMTIIMSVPEDKLPDFATTGAQRFERIDDRTARATIICSAAAAAPKGDRDDPSYKEASSMINRDDEAIQRLTKQALEGAPKDPAARAERLRAFVRAYISQKDLDTAMASASDVVRTKAGDCTEHAVLLAALLRADGIASRVVSGLIYADRFAGANDVFAYHMWTEALLGVNGTSTWVDLDATLPATGPAFDATHVAVLTSAMDDGKTASTMASLVPLLGRLQIKVEHVE